MCVGEPLNVNDLYTFIVRTRYMKRFIYVLWVIAIVWLFIDNTQDPLVALCGVLFLVWFLWVDSTLFWASADEYVLKWILDYRKEERRSKNMLRLCSILEENILEKRKKEIK